MKNNLQHLLSASALAVFICIAFGSMNDKKSDSSNERTIKKIQADKNLTQTQKDSLITIKKQKEIELRKEQTVSAIDLYNTYQDNEVSADNEYKGKRFYVEGLVKNIEKDMFDRPYVILKTNALITGVQCYIDNATIASKLKKGQRITVYGKCDGLMLNVLMKDCKVVENLNGLKKK